MSISWNVGFIGYGNMAQAIAKGLVSTGTCDPQQIYACAAHYDKLQQNAALLGIHPEENAEAVVRSSDCVVLAVKPYLIQSVVAPIADLLKDKVVISIASGLYFEDYEALLPAGTHHISTLPNTPIAVQEGTLLCEDKHSLSPEEYQQFTQMFEPIALIEVLPSKLVSAADAISGCAPAFTAMYLEALADGAVKHGLPRATAYRLAARMISGTGKLYLESGTHPGAMKDAVCSPGGITIKGVAALEKSGFRGAVIGAIDAIKGL